MENRNPYKKDIPIADDTTAVNLDSINESRTPNAERHSSRQNNATMQYEGLQDDMIFPS